jgi:CO/xanthine dehydrogenase FAD-binding subunit
MSEVLTLLEQYGDRARVLAGGQELIPAMTVGDIVPDAVIDLRLLRTASSLAEIKRNDGHLIIGSMLTHRTIERDPLIREQCGLLAESASVIGGGAQVRNKGTLGGGVCRSSTTGDYLASIAALDASMRVLSTAGERSISAADFFLSPFVNTMRPDELLVDVTVPTLSSRTGYAYYKLSFSAGCYTIASAACILELNDDNTCSMLRLALGSIASRPLRLHTLEAELVGRHIDTNALQAITKHASDSIDDPLGDVLASADYRLQMARIVAKRAVQAALVRCTSNTIVPGDAVA